MLMHGDLNDTHIWHVKRRRRIIRINDEAISRKGRTRVTCLALHTHRRKRTLSKENVQYVLHLSIAPHSEARTLHRIPQFQSIALLIDKLDFDSVGSGRLGNVL